MPTADAATDPHPVRDEHSGLLPLVQRVRGEFIEMPGLQLTLNQAARLWGIDLDTSERTLHALVGDGFLQRRGERYSRETGA